MVLIVVQVFLLPFQFDFARIRVSHGSEAKMEFARLDRSIAGMSPLAIRLRKSSTEVFRDMVLEVGSKARL